MSAYLIPQRVQQELLQPNFAQLQRPVTGGLSGAKIWECHSPHGNVALRKWPSSHPTPSRLAQIHLAMQLARQAGHMFVPRLFSSRDGLSAVSDGESLWELTQWMPGQADYRDQPSDSRLQSAMGALASLHNAWADAGATQAPSPTVLQRIELLKGWLLRKRTLSRIDTAYANQVSLVEETTRQLERRGPSLLNQLESIAAPRVTLHFVMRDIWSDHILFVDEHVSGIIDYGAGRHDEPATDVARLLASLVPTDMQRWRHGWRCYQSVNATVDLRRVEILDQAANLLGALQWLQWLVIEKREFETPVEILVARWQSFLARLVLSHY